VLALVAPVLVLASYVCAWLVVSNAAHRGLIASSIADQTVPVFQPILSYCRADLPGASALSAVWWRMNSNLRPTTTAPDDLHFVRVSVLSYVSPLAPPFPVDERG